MLKQGETWQDCYARYREYLQSKGAKFKYFGYGTVDGEDLFKIVTPGEKRLTLISGVHGEEKDGPITIADKYEEIADYAGRAGVGLNIYPMVNPYGWCEGERNASNGDKTNLLAEYWFEDSWVDELPPSVSFAEIRVAKMGARCAQFLYNDIRNNPTPLGMLDIHQDSDLNDMGSLNKQYAYVYNRPMYYEIADRAARFLDPAVGDSVELNGVEEAVVDEYGLVGFNYIDCTTQGLHRWMGCKNSVTIESAIGSMYGLVHQFNLTWIKGMIDLVKKTPI
jgi:hypothetical protein